MIHLLILRHGEASFDAPSDYERSLTPRGAESIRRVCSLAKDQLNRTDSILVSPLARAQQTAAIVCEEVTGLNSTVDTWSALKPESNVTDLVSSLLKYTLQKNESEQRDQTLLLVTHQPLVSCFLENLCGTSSNRGSSFFSNSASKYAMDTASLAYVTLDVIASSCGTLQWIRHPNSLI